MSLTIELPEGKKKEYNEPKWKERRYVSSLIVLVANEKIFAITDAAKLGMVAPSHCRYSLNSAIFALVVQVRGDIFYATRESEWKPSRWVNFPKKNIGNRVSRFISRIPGLQEATDFLDPWH